MKELIGNSRLLTDVFGSFPSFHDAEITELTLKRQFEGQFCPTLEASIQLLVRRQKFDIKIRFSDIFGLKLENFNEQNVIFDLIISESPGNYLESTLQDKRLLGVVRQTDIDRQQLYIKFVYCYSIKAEFICSAAIIDSVEQLPSDN